MALEDVTSPPSMLMDESRKVVELDDVALQAQAVSLSPKAVRLLGDPALFPRKAQQVLGVAELPAGKVKLMYKSAQADVVQSCKRRKVRIELESKLRPTPQQLALPQPDTRVSDKALQLLGDEDLKRASCRVVTPKELSEARQHPKVCQVLGEPAVLGHPKALQRLGSEMDVEQRRALMRSNEREAATKRQRERRELEAVLKALPTPEQLRLPVSSESQAISEKALRVLGDEALTAMARKVVTPEMRRNVSPKTLQLLGDSNLLGEKEKKLLGSFETPKRERRWWNQISRAVRVI